MLFRILISLFLLSGIQIGKATAQAGFKEGILIYRVDTVRSLVSHPAAFRGAQFKLYKKGDLMRIERTKVNHFRPATKEVTIQIRNKKGIYTTGETRFKPMAIFMSYDEERINKSKAVSQGMVKTYTSRRTGQRSTILSMPTEKVIITGSGESQLLEAQVTKALDVPVKQFFEHLQGVEGTPLQFTDYEYGWLVRYTLESVKAQPLPDELFRIDPKMEVKTMEQVLKELRDFK
ncbi:hypothetical protein [Telluribacter sp. SYSU D00476]|uniref:hypothetical protein n=1 Tax=Telluribacter sp. SYSU D00476 TaxID=2811430 RepID=UPI001FF208E6|nr:hypothetical protein [Telluribacter sp. SYSU D00476]